MVAAVPRVLDLAVAAGVIPREPAPQAEHNKEMTSKSTASSRGENHEATMNPTTWN